MEFCAEDECVEVTPEIVRVRKVELTATPAGPGEVAREGPQLTRRRGDAAADSLNGVPTTSRRLSVVAGALTSTLMLVGGVHRQPAAGAAEHRDDGEHAAAAAEGDADHHGDRLDRPRLQPAPAVGPVAGERGHLRRWCCRVRSGRSPIRTSPTGSRWELDPTLLESAEVTSENPFTVTYKIRPGSAVDGQRADRRRRLLVPVAPDGQRSPASSTPRATTSSPASSRSRAARPPW